MCATKFRFHLFYVFVPKDILSQCPSYRRASLCCQTAPSANKLIYKTHLPGFWVSLSSFNQPQLNLLSNV